MIDTRDQRTLTDYSFTPVRDNPSPNPTKHPALVTDGQRGYRKRQKRQKGRTTCMATGHD